MHDEQVGSLTTPTPSAVKDATQHLLAAVLQSRTGSNAGLASLARFHNRYATYTAFLLALACAARNCRSYRWRASIDREHWFCYFNDKATGPWCQPRPMLLPATASGQAAFFKVHCGALLGRLEQRAVGVPALRHRLRAVNSSKEVPLLFLINRCGDVAKLGTAEVLAELPGHIRMAPDAGRHYFATYLLQQQVEDPLIDFFLRHADGGVEPQSSTSVVSLHHARNRVCPLIDTHLGELGLRTLSGLAEH